MLKNSRKKSRGSVQLYSEIRKNILSLEIAPGTELDEVTLAKQFGISRTPVREALIRLSADNLILMVPNHSPRVAPLDLTDIRLYDEALQLCQRIVTRWAADRRTSSELETINHFQEQHARAVRRNDINELVESNRAFHSAIGAACGNPYFASTYDRLLNDGMRLIRIAMSTNQQNSTNTLTDYLKLTVDEHAEMVTAIEQQDSDKAESIAHLHASKGMSRIADYLSSHLASEIDLKSI